ncbi:unnamed protein product [Bemisia tabaci]|uniref:Bromo domain-containing protein n=1 Tax=Bemisia tabaci TaxID=7038 RepID=A0A9P0AB62_BEMTA|nr:unnamed protein product [Bemisia tabaci]
MESEKRGRKSLAVLPDAALVGKNPQDIDDLVQGFKILQKLLSARNIDPFLDRPNENESDIMANYYEVIDEPMWFHEVKEKYVSGAYSTIPEFVLDVRQIFANCFRFWGPKNPLTKVALRLETLFEQELLTLPADTQAVCSLEATHGFKEEDLVYKKEGVTSRLLQWVINEQSEKEMAETEELPLIERKEQQENLEKGVVSWENGILYADEGIQDLIKTMFELPQIGLFLCHVVPTFNLEQLSQYEVERMLLVPQFSKSLAALMTSLLSSRKDKSKVLYGPPMPYEVWSARLNNRVATWYKTYHTKKNKFHEILSATGIEHMFWLVMGEPNPLERFQFHELHFQKRVWILKTLLDTLVHSHKTVYDLLSDRLSIVPPEVLGEDKKGFSYLYFPAFTDLRVYRQSKSTYSKFNINRWEKIVRVPVANGDTDCPPSKCVLPSKNDFELLATSISELRNVYSNLVETEFSSKSNCDNKSSPLLENIDRLLKDWSSLESKHSINLSHIRQKMYREWKTLYDRSLESTTADIAYWEKDGNNRKPAEEEEEEEDSNDHIIDKTESAVEKPHLDEPQNTTTREINLRERKSKTDSNLSMTMMALNEVRGESDTSDEDEDLFDDSEEEWVAEGSKKRVKQPSSRRKKRCPSKNSEADAVQEAVDKNIKMNEELEKQKKDEKAQRLNMNSNTILCDSDKFVIQEPQRNLIRCKDPTKLLQSLADIKSESIKVIRDLVAPAQIKAEGTKPPSPETISIDDDDEVPGDEASSTTSSINVANKTPENGNVHMISMNLRVDQSPIRSPAIVTPSTVTDLPADVDDDVQILQTSVVSKPGAQSIPSPALNPMHNLNRMVSPQNVRLVGPNVSRMPFTKASFQTALPGNNLTPIKKTFPVVKNGPVARLRGSIPRVRNGMMQQTFRGMAPRMTSSIRQPNQSILRQKFRNPVAYNAYRTPVQQRITSSSASTPRRQSAPYTPPLSNSSNSRLNNLPNSAPSKAISNILSSVEVANSLSSGKRKSSLLNSITITPINNSAVTITPVLQTNQVKKVSRNLNFSSPSKSSSRLVYIKGRVILDPVDLCYSVQIANGRKYKLTPQQLDECRRNNGGVMPPTISIPVPEDVANLLEPEVVEID